MAEKVSPGIDLLFTAGSAGALARSITNIVNGTAAPAASSLADLSRSRLHANENAYASHLAIYKTPAMPQIAEKLPLRPLARSVS